MTTLQAQVNGIPVHYAEHGGGTPVIALPGVGVDHREMAASLEPVFADRPGYRRIYPDLPGMGRTPAPATVASNDDVLETLLGLVDVVVGDQAFLIAGHSHGGYLARAIANRRPGRWPGRPCSARRAGRRATTSSRPMTCCTPPVTWPASWARRRRPSSASTWSSRRRRRSGASGVGGPGHAPDRPGRPRADLPALGAAHRARAGATLSEPTLILAGRHDATVGYLAPWRLVEHYEHRAAADVGR